MIYTDGPALARAAMQVDLSDKAQVARLQELFRVYFDALNNAPAGIVGVGAITYAEQELINFQLTKG